MDTLKKVLKRELSHTITEEDNAQYLLLLDYVKANCTVTEQPFIDNLYLEYLGDFYGLLAYYNVSRRYRYITMLLNGYSSSNEFNGELEKIKTLDETDSNLKTIATILERRKLEE